MLGTSKFYPNRKAFAPKESWLLTVCFILQDWSVRYPEEYQKMDGLEKLAVVETLHQGQASS